MSSPRFPPLLSPYCAYPCLASSAGSLVLLTSVLGASTNWLVLRFVHYALAASVTGAKSSAGSAGSGGRDGVDGAIGSAGMEEQAGGRTKVVVLVSYLRDWEFWREGGRRLGLDLPRLASESRFVFIDGLTNLFFTSPSTAHSTSFPTVPPPTSGAQKITSPSPKQITKTILSQIDILKQTNDIILILDAPDLLLAATGAGPGSTSVTELGEAILDLREHAHSTILTLNADTPLVQPPSTHPTPLESNHAAFLLSQAHSANLSLSLRLLDTGTARDVSGVMRVTVGADDGASVAESTEGKGEMGNQREGTEIVEKEMLYFVGGDGGLRVFERGE